MSSKQLMSAAIAGWLLFLGAMLYSTVKHEKLVKVCPCAAGTPAPGTTGGPVPPGSVQNK